MKHRKKPIVVDVFQLNYGELIREDWFWDAVGERTIITHPFDFGKFPPEDPYYYSKTLKGTVRANAGDYIIRGNEEIYPCRSDIFEKTYELAESEDKE